MGAVADPFMIPGFTGDGHTALTEMIDEVEKQFETMIVNARSSIRTRAAAIHPELSPLGFKLLTVLSRSGSRQQGILAEEMEVDKAVMSRTIKQLECLGMVERTIDPHDGRALLVTMTVEGRLRLDASVDRDRRLLHDRLSGWDLEEIRRFSDLLARLNEPSA